MISRYFNAKIGPGTKGDNIGTYKRGNIRGERLARREPFHSQKLKEL